MFLYLQTTVSLYWCHGVIMTAAEMVICCLLREHRKLTAHNLMQESDAPYFQKKNNNLLTCLVQQTHIHHSTTAMLGLFVFDSWICFPQFIAKVKTANEDRITIELPTKWDAAPLGVTFRALLGKVSLSKAAVLVAVWAAGSMITLLEWQLAKRWLPCSLSSRSLDLLTRRRSWTVLSDCFSDHFLYLIYKL